MSLKQTIYFMALVGGLAGLICWAIVVWIPEAVSFTQESSWINDLMNVALLGLLIGGLTVFFADRWAGDQVVPRWVLSGVLIGFLTGAVSGFLQKWISAVLPSQKTLAVISSWLMAGAFIGFGTGLRWISLNRNRVLHALAGGLFGGLLGGVLFATLSGMGSGWVADLTQAVAFITTGIGISCGVTLAPVLLRDGVLLFISSGDPRVQNKLASKMPEWGLQDGDQYLVGSLAPDHSQSMYGHEVHINIRDQMVAARHAVLTGRKRRFYIDLHPENRGPQGLPYYALQVRGQDVTRPVELRDGDDIVVGQTLLRFETRKRRQ